MLGRLRDKHLETWLPSWLVEVARRAPRRPPRERHVLFALCDHYEPLWGHASLETGRARVEAFRDGYPRLARDFRDVDGRPPQHTFFYPGEQYDARCVGLLDELVRAGLGEVELHLHHDGDTADGLRRDLRRYLELLGAHGHFARARDGAPRFAFIHGNWCLANARRDGRWCGVDDELPILHEAGCYADFTFPAAPDESQPRTVDCLYWPTGDLSRRRAHDRGERARVGTRYDDRLLFVTGPLALATADARWLPRIESAAISGNDPASVARVRTWISQAIHVEGRPEWIFVKASTHGAPEANARSLLGEGGRALHEALARGPWRLHYVTAREMYNVAIAAMCDRAGDPNTYRDFVLPKPPVRDGLLR